MQRHIVHPYQPIINSESKVLILGTCPSVKSIENGFYYGHKQNRFWKLMGVLFNEDLTNADNVTKRECLLKNRVALYDVIYECDIEGSDDNKITNEVPVDLVNLIKDSKIELILLNGTKSYELFKKYFPEFLSIAIKMPSTSPRNASYTFERLKDNWKMILDFCK